MELTERVKEQRKAFEQMYADLHETPINLDTLFDDAIAVIRDQYVGYEQKKKYFTPAEYHNYIYSHFRYRSLTLNMLARSLHQMVGDLHDRHLRFSCDDWTDFQNHAPLLRVRAQGIYLYVTWADPDTGLVPGDRILKVQSMTPVRIRKFTRHNCFYSTEKERELWGGYLRMAESLLVEHENGEREEIRLTQKPAAASKETFENAFSMLTEDTAYLKLEDLTAEKTAALIADAEEQIAGSNTLIVDLRRCYGGDEGAGWELLPFALTQKKTVADLMGDEGSYVRCSKKNCDIRLHQLQTFRQQLILAGAGNESRQEAQADPIVGDEQEAREDQISERLWKEQLEILDEEIAFYRENYDKGMVYRPADADTQELIAPAKKAPGRILVLTDTFCEDAGEQLAAMLKRCVPKVTLIGRPTMGTLDFEDPILLQIHEHMTISCPIRMTKAAYEGNGISEKGIPVDVYIPWTPEEIKEDLILKRAMEREAGKC